MRNVSVLIAIGVGDDEYRHILGAGEGEKEELEGWRGFSSWKRAAWRACA